MLKKLLIALGILFIAVVLLVGVLWPRFSRVGCTCRGMFSSSLTLPSPEFLSGPVCYGVSLMPGKV